MTALSTPPFVRVCVSSNSECIIHPGHSYLFFPIYVIHPQHPNVEVTWPALGSSGRAPRRYGLPFLSDKIITPGRNGKACNEARMSYGCGPEGSRSDFQGIPSETRIGPLGNPLKPRSRYEWLSCEARNLGRIAAWSDGLQDDCGITFTDC